MILEIFSYLKLILRLSEIHILTLIVEDYLLVMMDLTRLLSRQYSQIKYDKIYSFN